MGANNSKVKISDTAVRTCLGRLQSHEYVTKTFLMGDYRLRQLFQLLVRVRRTEITSIQ